MKRRTSLGILALSVLLITMAASPVYGQQAEEDRMVSVLIGFKDRPRAQDLEWLNGKRAIVRKAFDIVPAVAATVPESAVARLRANPNVAYIEEDGVVRASEDTLDWGVDRIDAEIVWGGAEDSANVVPGFNSGRGVDVAVLDTGIDLDVIRQGH